jgi:hypothetical protein
MGTQVLVTQRSVKLVQGMVAMCDGNEPDSQQRVAQKARRYNARDREVTPLFKQRFLGATEHRFHALQARFGALYGQLLEAIQHSGLREQRVADNPQLWLPALGEGYGRRLHPQRLIEQGAAAAVKKLSGVGQLGFTALYLKQGDRQLLFKLLNCIGNGRLALV